MTDIGEAGAASLADNERLHKDGKKCAVIVGAGHAGAELAVGLRKEGWAGRIILIGDETALPYHRPPLSKTFLADSASESAMPLRADSAYRDAGVELWRGIRVVELDRRERRIHLATGPSLRYDKVVLATGGQARALPAKLLQVPSSNVHTLRTVMDAVGLRSQMRPGAALLIIGGGYVGLEIAASSVQLGMTVHLVEAAPRVLARVTAPEVSSFFETRHRAAGVDIRTGVSVNEFRQDPAGRVLGVLLSDGTQLNVDMVLAAIGQEPAVELARSSGLHVDNGVCVDELTVTGDPDVLAIGDCTSHPSPLYGGRRIRLESVPNALEQARTAAATLCGRHRPHHAVPWFWSDQYDLRLKMVGLSQGYEQLVFRGDPDKQSFSAFYMSGSRILAVDTVNRPQEFAAAKRIIAGQIPFDPDLLRDEARPLR